MEKRQDKHKKVKSKNQFFHGRRLYNTSIPYYVSMGAGQYISRLTGHLRKPKTKTVPTGEIYH